jgi:predicted kinase
MKENKLLVLVIGNISTGKTTFIQNLNKRKNRIVIINDDYPDVNSGDLSHDIFEALQIDKTVVLEGNYVSRHNRARVINPVSSYIRNTKFICFDFGPGNNESLERRLLNPTSNKEKIIEVHTKFLIQYNKPIIQEGFSKIITCY